MKIGFSFGRCVRDIVNGTVPYDDVLFIIASTYVENGQQLDQVVRGYMLRSDYLKGLDENVCLQVARRLYDQGKILQPRLQGIARNMVSEDAIWGDILLSPQQAEPTVKAAWEQYRMLVELCGRGQSNENQAWR